MLTAVSRPKTTGPFRCLLCGTVDTASEAILRRSVDPEIRAEMTRGVIKKRDQRNAKIAGATQAQNVRTIPGASCQAGGLVQSLVTANGQTAALGKDRGSENGDRIISGKRV